MNNINIIIEIIKDISFVLIGMLVYRLFNESNIRKSKIVKKQAFTDQLTGIGNRYIFFSVIDKLIVKKKKFAVCFMDLDGFKQVNDSMGHDAGDELLVALSNTFKSKLPKNATAYRLGGDEFAILIQNVKTTEDVTTVLDDLKANLSEPFNIDNTAITLEYSIGISIYPEDADNRIELIMYADNAMYYIKENGKNAYCFHNKVLKAKLENKNKMQIELKKSFKEGRFGLEFQPRIDVKDTSKICFESLLYWDHPVLGKIPSSYFISQADEIALTVKLDQLVLDKVCKKINLFKENGYKNIKMAVNISNKHVEKKDFVDKICNILNENSIEKGDIQLELTDNINVSKIEKYKIMFEKIKECGAEIVINNLEVKYESLKLFSDLPIDELKLSSEYILNNSNLNQDVLEDIINLGKKMNYKILVTSIENEGQLTTAIKKGADKIQGNLLFKKMQIDMIEDFISEYNNYINRLDNIIISAKNIKNML